MKSTFVATVTVLINRKASDHLVFVEFQERFGIDGVPLLTMRPIIEAALKSKLGFEPVEWISFEVNNAASPGRDSQISVNGARVWY